MIKTQVIKLKEVTKILKEFINYKKVERFIHVCAKSELEPAVGGFVGLDELGATSAATLPLLWHVCVNGEVEIRAWNVIVLIVGQILFVCLWRNILRW